MSEKKHTPGPWKWSEEHGEILLRGVLHRTRNNIILNLGEFFFDSKQVEIMDSLDHPDATLIAAAPDLLEAAKMGLEHAQYALDNQPLDIEDGVPRCNIMRDIAKIQAAINEAKGEGK